MLLRFYLAIDGIDCQEYGFNDAFYEWKIGCDLVAILEYTRFTAFHGWIPTDKIVAAIIYTRLLGWCAIRSMRIKVIQHGPVEGFGVVIQLRLFLLLLIPSLLNPGVVEYIWCLQAFILLLLLGDYFASFRFNPLHLLLNDLLDLFFLLTIQLFLSLTFFFLSSSLLIQPHSLSLQLIQSHSLLVLIRLLN